MNPISKTSALIKQRGQGMTEYIIIVALIAIAAIGVDKFFCLSVRPQDARHGAGTVGQKSHQ